MTPQSRVVRYVRSTQLPEIVGHCGTQPLAGGVGVVADGHDGSVAVRRDRDERWRRRHHRREIEGADEVLGGAGIAVEDLDDRVVVVGAVVPGRQVDEDPAVPTERGGRVPGVDQAGQREPHGRPREPAGATGGGSNHRGHGHGDRARRRHRAHQQPDHRPRDPRDRPPRRRAGAGPRSGGGPGGGTGPWRGRSRAGTPPGAPSPPSGGGAPARRARRPPRRCRSQRRSRTDTSAPPAPAVIADAP